jgi:hypothetical protein
MKGQSQSWFKAIVFTLVVIMAATTAAFAAGKDSVQLPYDTKVGGTLLTAGDYNVQWDDSGKVDFLRGKKIVATGTAKIVKQSRDVRATNISTEKAADGTRMLTEIEVAGKNLTISFTADSAGKGEMATAK